MFLQVINKKRPFFRLKYRNISYFPIDVSTYSIQKLQCFIRSFAYFANKTSAADINSQNLSKYYNQQYRNTEIILLYK